MCFTLGLKNNNPSICAQHRYSSDAEWMCTLRYSWIALGQFELYSLSVISYSVQFAVVWSLVHKIIFIITMKACWWASTGRVEFLSHGRAIIIQNLFG